MLMAVPKFGRVKAARLLNQCRISQSKTVGGLSERQRAELVSLFNRVDGEARAACDGSLFVITGPSGAGKGTLIRALVERVPELEVAVSATTRAQREGEVDGRRVLVPDREEFRGASTPTSSSSTWRTSRAAATGRCGRRSSGSPPRAVCACSSSRSRERLRVQAEVPGASPSSSCPARRARAAAAQRATESAGEIEKRLALARAPARAARSSTTWS